MVVRVGGPVWNSGLEVRVASATLRFMRILMAWLIFPVTVCGVLGYATVALGRGAEAGTVTGVATLASLLLVAVL